MTDETPHVLIVEDEEDIAEGYALAMSDEYEVTTAYTGAEALETMDGSIDAVLLDRRMPGMSGEEVLSEIRNRGYDCGVAMVTAVMPDFDILEMGFDDYLVKPVDFDELDDVVKRMNVLGDDDGRVREYIAKSVKQASLETTKSDVELDSDDQYRQLRESVGEMSTELGDVSAEMTDEEFELVLKSIVRNLSGGNTR